MHKQFPEGVIGRAIADITKWVEYSIEGMAVSFEKVLARMGDADNKGLTDLNPILKKLDPKQRKALELFQQFEFVTSRQIGELFGFKPRTSASLCASWVQIGFLKVVDSSNKGRKYALGGRYIELLQ